MTKAKAMRVWSEIDFGLAVDRPDAGRLHGRMIHLVDAFHWELLRRSNAERRAPFTKLYLDVFARRDPLMEAHAFEDEGVAMVAVPAYLDRLGASTRRLRTEVFRVLESALVLAADALDWDPAVGRSVIDAIKQRDPVNRQHLEKWSRRRPAFDVFFESDLSSARVWVEYEKDGGVATKTVKSSRSPTYLQLLLPASKIAVKGGTLSFLDRRGRAVARVDLG